MTFHFKIFPFLNADWRFGSLGHRLTERSASAHRRPRLIAHWQRGPDGRLEIRWGPPPD